MLQMAMCSRIHRTVFYVHQCKRLTRSSWRTHV